MMPQAVAKLEEVPNRSSLLDCRAFFDYGVRSWSVQIDAAVVAGVSVVVAAFFSIFEGWMDEKLKVSPSCRFEDRRSRLRLHKTSGKIHIARVNYRVSREGIVG